MTDTAVQPSKIDGPNLGDPIIGTSDDADVPLSTYAWEDWAAFILFWGLAGIVFLQFFTRYILNDSLAWTEEIARYVLIGVTFIGAGMAARKNSHIHVEFFYVYLSKRVALALSTLVDILRVLFFGYCTYLAWNVTWLMGAQSMVVVDISMSWVFGTGCLGFAIMTWRSLQLAWRHWQTGESLLTRVHVEGRHQ